MTAYKICELLEINMNNALQLVCLNVAFASLWARNDHTSDAVMMIMLQQRRRHSDASPSVPHDDRKRRRSVCNDERERGTRVLFASYVRRRAQRRRVCRVIMSPLPPHTLSLAWL